MDSAHPLAALERLLQRQIELGERLLQCLDQERAALTEADTSAIEQSIGDKIDCLQVLERLEGQRQDLLLALGFTPDHNGMTACLARWDRDDRLVGHWQALLQNLGRCQEANRRNGALVHALRQQAESALAVLRGADPAAGAYDASGSLHAEAGTTRTLGRV